MNQEYKVFIPIAVLVRSGIRIEHEEITAGAVSPAPSLYLWNGYPIAIVPVLENYSNQLATKSPYITSITSIKMRLCKL